MFDKMKQKKQVVLNMIDFVGEEKTVKVMSYVKGLASKSSSPICKLLCTLEPKIEAASIDNVKELKDFGMQGTVGNEHILLGTAKVMLEKSIALHGDQEGRIYFAINGNVQAVFKFSQK